jgi:hypothetical protein
MLHKCANEACSTPFRRLREGKLFQVETDTLPGGTCGGIATQESEQVARRALLAVRCVLAIRHADLRPASRRYYGAASGRNRPENRQDRFHRGNSTSERSYRRLLSAKHARGAEMKTQKPVFCTICGEPRRDNEGWFLLTENRWTDRLKVLGWSDQLVTQPGAYPACSAAHVQQLVVHWMTMGSLALPFARVPAGARSGQRKRRRDAAVDPPEPDALGVKVIGELAIHRESLSRILVESPESLASILEALISAVSGDRRPVLAEEGEKQRGIYELVEV